MDVAGSPVLVAMVIAAVSPYSVGIAAWCALTLAGVVLEIMARLGARHLSTAGQTLRCVMGSTVGRWAVVLGWMWLGWHFFVR